MLGNAGTYLIRCSTFNNNVALVQLKLDNTVDSGLRCWDGRSEELSFRAEPVSIVQDPRQLDREELVSQRSDVSVQGHTLQIHVGDSENGSGRGFVTTSRLDTDESVLDNVDSSDTVFPGKGVQHEEHIDSIGVGSRADGDFDGETLFKDDLDLLGLVGSVFGRGGQFPHVGGRGGVGVLEDTSFVRDVEEVFI